jgi:hypothetical protein
MTAEHNKLLVRIGNLPGLLLDFTIEIADFVAGCGESAANAVRRTFIRVQKRRLSGMFLPPSISGALRGWTIQIRARTVIQPGQNRLARLRR